MSADRQIAMKVPWISVDDYLPEDDQRVFTWAPEKVYHFRDYRFGIHLFRDERKDKIGGQWWLGIQNYMHGEGDITHWAPIPGGPE